MSTILRYHLRIMGEQGVGKTSLELRFKVNNFSGEVVDPVPCMEGYYKHTVVARLPYLLGIEKLATTADYPKKFVEHEIRNSDGFLLVYSVASRSSFDRIQEYHRMIHRFKEADASHSFSNNGVITKIPIVLIGNQWDRIHDRAVSKEEGLALAQELGCSALEVSAKSGFNVEKAFHDLVRILDSRQTERAAALCGSGDCDTRRRSRKVGDNRPEDGEFGCTVA
ncbi:ras-2 protein [Dactylonectria macrodidyma]|uniref:Ras-2 protein n=1 Tax=Dactylonectria macrodidyma TaxID=307937 RepID=A0A9P9EWT1_9HYPO|nr:ras-2 protein [Dactylonectria macrodidyma]